MGELFHVFCLVSTKDVCFAEGSVLAPDFADL